jgi:nickel-dependent lactate racemase
MSLHKFSIGYGKEQRCFTIDERNLILDVKARELNTETDEEKEILRALAEPIGTPTLAQIVKPGESVVIITSDITRPCPSAVILLPLIKTLNDIGIRDDDITVVFALGSHRRHTEEEMRRLAGLDVYRRVHTIDSDPEDTVFLGTTSRGTPVNIFSTVAQADRRICVGNIEFHYFAGYSGGGKALMPGVSDRDAIQANHSRMVEDTAKAGAIDDNNVRLDIEEATDICGCDFILNVVLDENKKVVKAVAGDHRAAHRVGCAFLDEMYKVKLPRLADIVIASPGGYPKDINLYQTQKALDNAKHAVRPGGIIVLAGQCPECFGEHVFEEWLLAADTPKDLIDRVRREFRLGGHKAAAIAMVLEKARVFFVSDMPEASAAQTFMTPYHDLNLAIADAFVLMGPDAGVIVMAHAGSTLPYI